MQRVLHRDFYWEKEIKKPTQKSRRGNELFFSFFYRNFSKFFEQFAKF